MMRSPQSHKQTWILWILVLACLTSCERCQEAECEGVDCNPAATPYVLDIEGRTIELTGTAQEQYVEWRKLLREIYAQETSIPSQ